MIDRQTFDALVATYDTHGWVLRQVVVRDRAAEDVLSNISVPIRLGVTNAAWFSRPPQPGVIPWEIRYLGPTPYALVEHLDENSPDFETRLHQTEQRLADAVPGKGNGLT